MKAKVNIKNIIAYLQGNIRYKLFYTKFNFLIPLHIKEQIETRIMSMNQECYNNGSCIMCGCMTTHLQMANKACEGQCYPKMMDKKTWQFFKKRKLLLIDNIIWKLFNECKFKKV